MNAPITITPLAFTETAAADARGVTRRLWAGPAHVPAMLREAAGKPLAVDIETAGKGHDSWTIKVVGLATETHALALDPRDPLSRDGIRELLEAAPLLVFHNSPFDVPPLVERGIMPAATISKVWDTLILARMAEPDTIVSKGLGALVQRYLGAPAPDKDLDKIRRKAVGARTIADYFRIADVSSLDYLRDNLLDAMSTAQLFRPLYESAIATLTVGHPYGTYGVTGAAAENLVYREAVVNRVMLARSAKGLRVDEEFLDTFISEHADALAADAATLQAQGIDPGNGAHMTSWLDERGLLPSSWPRTPKTRRPSSKAEDLERLDHELVRTFLRWKEQDKLMGYLGTVSAMAEVTGRIHPQVGILGASATGRMAYSDPPLQQFPGGARGIILADEGDNLTSVDWTSVEPYVLSCLARDEGLALFYEGGGDIYAPVVEMAGITRKVAKVVVLAAMYGQGITSLAAGLKVTQDEAQRIRANVMAAMPGVDSFIQRIKQAARQYGVVCTLSGRILPVPKFNGQVAAYKGVNYVVQGSAADVLSDTIFRIHEAGLADAVYLAVHDELVVSTEAAHDIRRIMEAPPEALHTWAGRTTALRTDRADLGIRWAAA